MVNEKKPVICVKPREELLQDLMDAIPDLIYFKDKNNRFIMVSKTKAEQVGSTPEEIIGKTDFDFYPKELAEKTVADDKHVVETGESIIDRVERHILPSREERWVSTIKVPLRDETGAIIGSMGISRDITEIKRVEEERVRAEAAAEARMEAQRASAEAAAKIAAATSGIAQRYKGMINELKQAQKKLTEESNLLQSLLDSIPALIYVKDRDGRFLRVSKSYQMIHPESMVGKTAFDLFPEDQAIAGAKSDKRVMETGEPIDEEGYFTAPDGSKHHVLITKAPLFDGEGNIVGTVGIVREKPEKIKEGL
jgi:two-component system sensor histidine kinase/response regulator